MRKTSGDVKQGRFLRFRNRKTACQPSWKIELTNQGFPVFTHTLQGRKNPSLLLMLRR
jgi:hypothetical protein